jgi:internalin A
MRAVVFTLVLVLVIGQLGCVRQPDQKGPSEPATRPLDPVQEPDKKSSTERVAQEQLDPKNPPERVSPRPDKKEPPKPFPDAIVEAWKDAGAEIVWPHEGTSGFLWFTDEHAAGAVPAFFFPFPFSHDGVVATLPAPDVPFGLVLPRGVTDAGLKNLAHLKTLTTLHLFYTQVTDVGLKELAGFKKLNTLELSGRQLTDTGLRTLREIGLLHALSRAAGADGKRPTKPEDVTTLDLSMTQVTGTGLKELAGLKNLTTLTLDLALPTGLQTRVTDTGLRTLREIGLLHALSRAAGADGKRPTKLDDIVTLDLSHTPVTDAGLKELAGLKNLTALDLSRTQVTRGGVAELQKALPKCHITGLDDVPFP